MEKSSNNKEVSLYDIMRVSKTASIEEIVFYYYLLITNLSVTLHPITEEAIQKTCSRITPG